MFAAGSVSDPIALNVLPHGTEPDMRFGVVSDVHVREATGPFGTEALYKAFAWFRDQGVDGVVIAGDMADYGLLAQLQCVADAWEKAFPGGKGAGGKPVEKLFIYGNHDIEGFKYSKVKPALEEDGQGLCVHRRALGRLERRARHRTVHEGARGGASRGQTLLLHPASAPEGYVPRPVGMGA